MYKSNRQLNIVHRRPTAVNLLISKGPAWILTSDFLIGHAYQIAWKTWMRFTEDFFHSKTCHCSLGSTTAVLNSFLPSRIVFLPNRTTLSIFGFSRVYNQTVFSSVFASVLRG